METYILLTKLTDHGRKNPCGQQQGRPEEARLMLSVLKTGAPPTCW